MAVLLLLMYSDCPKRHEKLKFEESSCSEESNGERIQEAERPPNRGRAERRFGSRVLLLRSRRTTGVGRAAH